MRVTIVGAGVVGLSIAWELSRRGAQVRLIERGRSGCETSWAAAGILPATRRESATDPLERLRGLSHELYPQWAETLAAITGIDSGLRRSGGLYLASSRGEAASLLAGLEYQRDLGLTVTQLTPDELAIDEPALESWAKSASFRAAMLSHDEWQVRPPDLLSSLRAACVIEGVQIEELTNAELFLNDHVAAIKLQTSAGNTELNQADKIVICGGPWTGKFAALGLANSVIPIRGQMLMYRLDPSPPKQPQHGQPQHGQPQHGQPQHGQPQLRRIVNEGHRYLVPRDDGRLLVGSCEEEVGFQPGTTAEMLEPLARWAASILTRLSDMQPERSWSALRPATFDGFPLIGKVPDIDNLYLATGHYRSGIHLAPATAAVMADILFDQTPVVDVAAFRVARMMSEQ